MEDKLVPAGAADDVWRTEWLHMMEYCTFPNISLSTLERCCLVFLTSKNNSVLKIMPTFGHFYFLKVSFEYF